jgi:hypothetical protein
MEFLKYTFDKNRLQFFLAAFIFCGLFFAAYMNPEWHKNVAWLEAITGVGTFVFALFVWLNGLMQTWEDNLPKRITVQYKYQGRLVMVSFDSLLTSVSDARQWALQIGQQMSGCQRLQFDPFFDLVENGIRRLPVTGKAYKSYTFTYFLKSLPVPDNGTDEVKASFLWKLENGCYEIRPEYASDGSFKMVEGYNAGTAQNITTSL